MIPVTQTTLGDIGNCEQACIASIFECPIEDVPDFRALHEQNIGWWGELVKWCRERGSVPIRVQMPLREEDQLPPHAFCVLGGTSERRLPHSVVGVTKQRKGPLVVLHDPHPDGRRQILAYGVTEVFPEGVEDVTYFVALSVSAKRPAEDQNVLVCGCGGQAITDRRVRQTSGIPRFFYRCQSCGGGFWASDPNAIKLLEESSKCLRYLAALTEISKHDTEQWQDMLEMKDIACEAINPVGHVSCAAIPEPVKESEVSIQGIDMCVVCGLKSADVNDSRGALCFSCHQQH